MPVKEEMVIKPTFFSISLHIHEMFKHFRLFFFNREYYIRNNVFIIWLTLDSAITGTVMFTEQTIHFLAKSSSGNYVLFNGEWVQSGVKTYSARIINHQSFHVEILCLILSNVD